MENKTSVIFLKKLVLPPEKVKTYFRSIHNPFINTID